MSYDLSLVIPACTHCGRDAECVLDKYTSPTYNYGVMIRKADEIAGGQGCSFDAVHGKTGKEAAAWFAKTLDAMGTHGDIIGELEPDNGWGTFDRLKDIFWYYLRQSKDHPNAVWGQIGTSLLGKRCCAGWTTAIDEDDVARHRKYEEERLNGAG